MGAIEEVYEDLEADMSLETFREAVEDKVEQMGGLADEETAAVLIAHELEENRVASIAELDPDSGTVKFLAKVQSVGEVRTFDRDNGDPGKVVNVMAADETGSVRLTFWDEHAQAIEDEQLEPGTVLRVKGRTTDGYTGLEVNVDDVEPAPDVELDVEVDGPLRIEDLQPGDEGVTIRGQVLATEPMRTFDRDDGSEGRVANLVIGDETGRIRVTLWGEHAETVESISPESCLAVVDASVRERDERTEVHLGSRGSIRESEDSVSFVPSPTPISEIEEDDVVDLAGVVRSTDQKRTFERDDGSTGQVRNVRIQDRSGDIRVAMWGETADLDLAPGDTVWFGDVEIQEGWQDDLEASVSWQSTAAKIDLAITESPPSVDSDEADPGGASLTSFEAAEEPDPAESVEFTGTVVQTGTPVIVDDGEEAITVETDADVMLGQDVTVSGERRGDRVDADQIRPIDGKR